MTYLIVRTNSVENVYPDNGWRPMSIEKVLELQRNFIKTPNVQLHALKNPPGFVMDGFEEGNFVKITQRDEMTQEPIKNHPTSPLSKSDKKDSMEYLDLIKIIEPPHNEIIVHKNKGMNRESQNDSKLNSPLRKAKMVEYSDTVTHPSNSIVNEIFNKIYNNETNDKHIKTNISSRQIQLNKSYEVKENTVEEDLLAAEQELLDNKSFNADVSKLTSVSSTSNFTANLLNILANYNIRTGDKLPNYAISLRQNTRKSHNHDYIFLYVPVRNPLKYNNANHLPVDPLLAVLLSNYGYYLPRLYGFPSGYNNLYGYLASNNIHNNKPFGSYKIFSDSDSLH